MSRIDSPKTILPHPGDNVTDDELWEHLHPYLGREFDWSEILQGDMSERVRNVIAQQIAKVNSTLAYRNSEVSTLGAGPGVDVFAARVAHRQWRSKALRFRSLLEHRLSESRLAWDSHRRAKHAEMMADGRDNDRSALRALTFAVLEHEEACRESERNASAEDRRLWAILDDIRIGYRGSLSTLADMADGVWYEEG